MITVSGERLADFCICQVYAISGFEASYRKRWDVSHSFGQKAVSRYLQTGKQRRFYEDRWLKSFGFSRADIYASAESRKRHPSRVLSFLSMRRLQNEDCSPPRQDISSAGTRPCCGHRSLPLVEDADMRSLVGCGQRRNTPNSIGCAVKCGMKRRNADEYDQSTECRVPV